MGSSFFNLQPIQALFGDGISIACELLWWEACYGRVGGMLKEPLPRCEVARN